MSTRLHHLKKLLAVCLIALLFPLLAACDNSKPSAGVIALVNGEEIELKALQTIMDIRFSAPGINAAASLEEMRNHYGDALNLLIIHALARQELAENNLTPRREEYQEYIKSVESELGAENLDELLEEAAIRKDEWEQLMKDQMTLERFKNKMLLPHIQISLSEVREYYKKHENDFVLPEIYDACFLTSPEKDALGAWCNNLPERSETFSVIAQCIDASYEDIPLEWREEVKKLKSGTCASVKEAEGNFQTVAKLGQSEKRAVSLSEAYPLIENLLTAEKQEQIFNDWLAKKLQSSKILVSSELKKYYSQGAQKKAKSQSAN